MLLLSYTTCLNHLPISWVIKLLISPFSHKQTLHYKKKKKHSTLTDKTCFSGKRLETTSDFISMQQISRSDQKSQQTILRIIQGKESYCSSIHQQSAAIRSSPSSVPFSCLCGSLKTRELHSLQLNHRITRSLSQTFLVHRNRSTCSGITGELFSHKAAPPLSPKGKPGPRLVQT